MFPAADRKAAPPGRPHAAEAAAAMAAIMRGEAAPAQIAGLLVGLAMKGERPAELVGFARRCAPMRCRSPPPGAVFDTCGTGGDRSGTFNISTAVGDRAGGVRHARRQARQSIGVEPVRQRRRARGAGRQHPGRAGDGGACLDEVGVAFLFAPTFHPAMRHAAQARKDLGVRTAFNLLGPLTNPARPARQIVGVPRPGADRAAGAVALAAGLERAWVVHGADGLDELSTTGYTKVSECRDGAVQTFYVHPADFGLSKGDAGGVEGRRRGDQRAMIVRWCSAAKQVAPRDVVLLNAGAALFVAGGADTVQDGIARRGGHRQRRGRWVLDAVDRCRIAEGAPRERERRPARGDRGRDTGARGCGDGARAAAVLERRAAASARRRGAPFTARCRARIGERDRRVQAPLAVTWRAARGLRPGRDRHGLRGWRERRSRC